MIILIWMSALLALAIMDQWYFFIAVLIVTVIICLVAVPNYGWEDDE